jgi:hypothetical protein
MELCIIAAAPDRFATSNREPVRQKWSAFFESNRRRES